jgi:hypothetical protein
MGAIRRSSGSDAKFSGTPLIQDAMGESAPHRRGNLAGPIDCRAWLAVRECSMDQIDANRLGLKSALRSLGRPRQTIKPSW